MKPSIIKGKHHRDERGIINFNNDFNALGIKRMYSIENINIDFVRAWQGHKIEQRWFSAIRGSFTIKLIQIDDWMKPSVDLPQFEFILKAENFDILHVPAGYMSSIQANEPSSKLLLFSDYLLDEVADDYRFPANYFN